MISEVDDQAALISRLPMDQAFAVDLDESKISAIDEVVWIQLSEAFYERIYSDKDEWFQSIFSIVSKEDAIQNLYEYLIQRFGGETYYSQRKGPTTLMQRHLAIDMSTRALKRWLLHMDDAIDTMEEHIDERTKTILMKFFLHMGSRFVAARQKAVDMSEIHTYEADERVPSNNI